MPIYKPSLRILIPLLLAATLSSQVSVGADAMVADAMVADSQNTPTVTVATVALGDLLARTHVSGTLVAKEEVLINPQIGGYEIQQILVDIGDTVKAGDVLVKLDARTLEAQLAQADADVVRAKANVRQAQSQIDSAKANLTQATTSLTRNQRLRSSGSIPTATLDDSQAAAGVAQAAFDSAKEGLNVAAAQLTQLQAQRDLAALNLSRATIKAPVGGIIAQRTAKQGAIASTGGEPMLKIIANGDIELEAEVVETALNGVQPGNQADISIAGAGNQTGKVRRVSPTVDPQTRLGLVRITLDKNPAIRSGGFADGWITVNKKQALMVPSTAVQSNTEGDAVTVVKDGVIEKRSIVAGILFDGKREVIKGLTAGETVLVRAGNFFRDGDLVKVARPVLDIPVGAAP